MTCEVKHDNALPEVVAELTLAETGEMLDRDMVEIISQPATNKTDLVISGLLPGKVTQCQGCQQAMEAKYIIKT